MDSLALLCNLHADGPLTLQRLRRIGCESLQALLEMDVSELEVELDGDEDTAERFQREATLLAERLEGGWDEEESFDDDEEEGEADDEDETNAYGIEEIVDDETDELVEEEEPEPAGEVFLGAEALLDEPEVEEDVLEEEEGLDESGVDRVLDTWRSLDRTAPPTTPTEYVVPRPPADTRANRALAGSSLDGLTPELAERLGTVGVLSLRGLVEAPALALARELSLSFTRVRRLQFLAGRELAELPEEAPEPEATAPSEPLASPEPPAAIPASPASRAPLELPEPPAPPAPPAVGPAGPFA
jgi:hypothetical protein